MKQRRLLIAAASVVGFAATLSLGFWQLSRGKQKESLQAAIEQRGRERPVDARELLGAADPASLVHRRVVLTGQWDAAHTVFLDNRQMDGRVGFYVVTPLVIGRDAAIAVQRGWAPRNFEDRTRLPPVATPGAAVTIEGRLAPPPAKLYELGEAGRGAIRQNLDLAAWRAETKLPLMEHVSLQQTAAASEGLLRDWPAPAVTAERNYGYAVQWWAMSGLIAVLYVWFQLIAPHRRTRRA
ncbi:MAG TPA: SURF1 family protein [Ramlibacter sp.]|uniref:SURF1 family protein n=1 Tax=Ramlibacter sp. TaxID=1917967 RepID=UPI002BE7F2B3|nr:SURF1 family protein [Ramlibacter sp.]HVZ44545.1 SURF1 family protein [Ramlibacter sp.]